MQLSMNEMIVLALLVGYYMYNKSGDMKHFLAGALVSYVVLKMLFNEKEGFVSMHDYNDNPLYRDT